VTFANDRVESIEADAATTSTEVVAKLANKIGLKDTFGFSVFVAIFHKVNNTDSYNWISSEYLSLCFQCFQGHMYQVSI